MALIAAGDPTYAANAMSAIAPDVQVFTSSGTWTKSGSAKIVKVEVIGGGGAGGGAGATGASQVSFGDGGGGGEYAVAWYHAGDLSATETVTIGAGGTAGTGAGGNGGTTSFGSHVTAAGGGGGGIRTAGTAPLFSSNGLLRAGGTGGTGGNYRVAGGAGVRGYAIATGVVTAGDGGQSHLSGQALATVAAAGNAGVNYGGGGSGSANVASASAQNGGAGAKGVCIVTTWM